MPPIPDTANTPRRTDVLLIHGGALGDLVLSVAWLRGLAPLQSGGRLYVLCRQRIACFFARRGWIAGWKSFESPRFLSLFHDRPADQSCLANAWDAWERCDVAVSMMGHAGTPFAKRLGELFEGSVLHVDPKLSAHTERARRHITTQWQANLQSQGRDVATLPGPPVVAFGAPRRSAQRSVLIHPGSGGRAKCWALEHYEQLALRLQRDGYPVRFMIGPADAEMLGADLQSRLAETAAVVQEEDVCVAAAEVLDAGLFVGNDAGMTHLAAVLPVPTVAIFTATDPEVWRPVGPEVVMLSKPTVDQARGAVQATVPPPG